jgi:hypothetical protein
VLPVGDQVDQALGVERAPTERMGRDLPVHDLCGDVGVVRRHLAPAFRPGVGPDANEPHVPRAERLDLRDPHARAAARRWPIRR